MTATYSYTTIATELRDRVLYATLSRPDVLNAVNKVMHEELQQLFVDVAHDSGVDVVAIRGAGRAFCAGGDIKEMSEGELTGLKGGESSLITSGAARLIRDLIAVPQPIVAILNGDAVGLGATLALMCDIVIAADTARIGDPHVRVGLVAGDGGAVVWPLLVGVNRAKEYLMTGRLLTAREAERIGLVNAVHPQEELDAASERMIRSLADGPSMAVRWTKQAINTLLLERCDHVLDLSLSLEALSASLPAHREAVQAFNERRKPRFH